MFKELFTEANKTLELYESKFDMQPVIDLVKSIKDFDYWRGPENYKANAYKIEINTKDDIRYEILLNFKLGKNSITKITPDTMNTTVFKTPNAPSGVIEFAKQFAKMSKSNDDYWILVDRIEGLLYV